MCAHQKLACLVHMSKSVLLTQMYAHHKKLHHAEDITKFFTKYLTQLGMLTRHPYHIRVDKSYLPKLLDMLNLCNSLPSFIQKQLAEMQAAGVLKSVNHSTSQINSFVITAKKGKQHPIWLDCCRWCTQTQALCKFQQSQLCHCHRTWLYCKNWWVDLVLISTLQSSCTDKDKKVDVELW